jgi:NitT/TauT family transport system permease protein
MNYYDTKDIVFFFLKLLKNIRYMKKLFELGGEVDDKTVLFLQILGWVLLFMIWYIIAELNMIPNTILPHPISHTYVNNNGDMITKGVLYSFKEFFIERNGIYHIGYSLFINIMGYIIATIGAITMGFIIGLIPFLRHLISKQIDALRFLPLPSTTGIFMAIFGMGIFLKINFLAFGIFIYLLPTVIQRIYDTEKVHLQTIYTLGANNWHKLKYVYFPSVLSRVSNDIMVLVAISWTYIVIIEVIGNVGGLGGLTAVAERGRVDLVYCLLILIIFIGFIQDKLLRKLDKQIFKFKYS